jgi:hypothetical protein
MTFYNMDFDCITPLGPARCKGMSIEGDITFWLTDINSTREPWWWLNEDFRFASTVSDRTREPSPFGKPSSKLAKQIQRYKENGWL